MFNESHAVCEPLWTRMAEVSAKPWTMPSQLEASLKLATIISLGPMASDRVGDTIQSERAIWKVKKTERTKVRRKSLVAFLVREIKFSLGPTNFAFVFLIASNHIFTSSSNLMGYSGDSFFCPIFSWTSENWR